MSKILLLSLSIILCWSSARAQDTTSSLAFKKNRPDDRAYFYYYPDLAYPLWQHFNLMKEANSGNALAEHELGLRYILGQGVIADTVKAAYWIGKAAEQNLPGACYNYGILLNNGWGVQWNPFEAYDYFLKAARNDMPQAEYLIGLSYIDNLIVKRNWSEAFKWIKRSAAGNFKPALATLNELRKNISFSKIDTALNDDENDQLVNNASKPNNQTSLGSTSGLVFIDFSAVGDTVSEISNKMLIEDLLHEGNNELAQVMHVDKRNDTTLTFDSAVVNLLIKFAESGSPEALTIMGRMYELGSYFPKDLIQASVYYIRAVRFDSPRAPVLLWKMLKDKNYFVHLKKQIDENDPRAMFVWYGLFSIGIDAQLTETDAVNLLKKSASLNYLPAMNELGLDLYTGKYLKQDRDKAIEVWEFAKNLGSSEASIRISIAKIYGYLKISNFSSAIDEIRKAIKDGSVLAQATLAYCYRNGIGVEVSEPEAVKYYRFAAQRGSRFAFDELKQMYDAVRPTDKIFRMN